MNDGLSDATDSPAKSAVSDSGSPVKTEAAAALCPYCGAITPAGSRCSHCRGLLDPLSRQATTNTMGPWFIRDDAQPFRPGCSYHTLVSLIDRGKITRTTIIRGPSTRQFWMFAGKAPGVAHRLGVCHSCQEESSADDFACNNCGAVFTAEEDRQRLGLGPVMEVPGQAIPEVKEAPTRAPSPRPPRRASAAPSPAIASPIDSPPPWEPKPSRGGGMMVGGILLGMAALAAAGYAVKTWVDASNVPPIPPADVLSAPAQSPETLPVPAASKPSEPQPTPPVAPPAAPEQPATAAPSIGEEPAKPSPGPGPAPAPVAWSNAWRQVRGLP
ncbi:MAG: hypothetical protein JNL50_01605 [Phycisphaerae bacterium]|nr:hypothetical protein [Phycisphaerae bacterium]